MGVLHCNCNSPVKCCRNMNSVFPCLFSTHINYVGFNSDFVTKNELNETSHLFDITCTFNPVRSSVCFLYLDATGGLCSNVTVFIVMN